MPEYFVIVIFVICDTCISLRRVTLNKRNYKKKKILHALKDRFWN